MTGIVNGDFEMDANNAQPTGWTVSILGNPVYTQLHVSTTYPHSGTKSVVLYNDSAADSHASMKQSVDLTNATYLKFWHKYGGNIAVQNPIVRIYTTEGFDVLWSETGKATTTFAEVVVDVSGYSGVHEIEFSFEAVAT